MHRVFQHTQNPLWLLNDKLIILQWYQCCVHLVLFMMFLYRQCVLKMWNSYRLTLFTFYATDRELLNTSVSVLKYTTNTPLFIHLGNSKWFALCHCLNHCSFIIISHSAVVFMEDYLLYSVPLSQAHEEISVALDLYPEHFLRCLCTHSLDVFSLITYWCLCLTAVLSGVLLI